MSYTTEQVVTCYTQTLSVIDLYGNNSVSTTGCDTIYLFSTPMGAREKSGITEQVATLHTYSIHPRILWK
jgi:hypothetical protein